MLKLWINICLIGTILLVFISLTKSMPFELPNEDPEDVMENEGIEDEGETSTETDELHLFQGDIG
jgi:hypothetical protein